MAVVLFINSSVPQCYTIRRAILNRDKIWCNDLLANRQSVNNPIIHCQWHFTSIHVLIHNISCHHNASTCPHPLLSQQIRTPNDHGDRVFDYSHSLIYLYPLHKEVFSDHTARLHSALTIAKQFQIIVLDSPFHS